MVFPDAVAIKYGAFTLFCHKLAENLQPLSQALQGDTRLTVEDCINRFNSSLHDFCQESNAPSLIEAVEDLNGLIRGRLGLIRRLNPAVAKIMDQIIVEIEQAGPTWRYEDDVETYHQQGRELAREFYENSNWTVTKKRLGRQVNIVYDYGPPDPEDLDLLGREAYGYPAAPMAYRSIYEENTGQTYQDIIVVRFLFDYDIEFYLALPFFFMHEYTAHIFATDYGNDCFNDGWMLYAADAFLWRLWNKSHRLACIPRDQASIFHEHFYWRLYPIPKGACRFARHFDRWLSEWEPQKFDEMTYELAAFEPSPGQERFWPNQFLTALQRDFDTKRKLLRQKIETARDARSLWSMLAPA